MILLKRIQPLVTATLIILLGLWFIRQPDKLVTVLIALVIGVLLTVRWQSKPQHPLEFITLIGSLLMFDLAAIAFVFFVETRFWQTAVILLVALSHILYQTNVFYYYFRTDKYHVHSLQHLSSYLNLAGLFMLTAAAYSVHLYLQWPTWALAGGVLVVSSLISFQTFTFNRLSVRSSLGYAAVNGLLATELFWAVSFWPTDAYVSSFVVTLVNFITLNLLRYHVMGQLRRSVIIRYSVIGASMLLLILLTARWV